MIRYAASTEQNLKVLLAQPHYLAVRYPHNSGEPFYLEVVPADDPTKARVRSSLSCVNVHFRAERGICIPPPLDSLATTVQILGSDLKVTREFSLPGTPSRTRMSPSGRYGAVTNFLTGHSYADTNFTTATTMVAFDAGDVSNLEDWRVFDGARAITDKGRNFWGVTFLDDDTFFVSMGIRGDRYLLRGDPIKRRLSVVATRIECPSVAPDGRHLTFRRSVIDPGGQTSMPLFLLDLDTMVERRLTYGETVDGQPEWLDSRRFTIGTPTGPPNVVVFDIDSRSAKDQPWPILVPDALSVTYVVPKQAH